MIWRGLKNTLIILLWKKNKRLTFIEAIRRVRWLRMIAIPMGVIALLLLLLSAAKFLHMLFWQTDSLSAAIWRPIGLMIQLLFIDNPYLSTFWEVSPLPAVEPINTLGNYYAALLGCVAIIAGLMLKSANHLSLRIKNAREKAEERRWVNQIEGRQNQTITQPDISAIVFTAEPTDRWHARPLGIIVLTVTSAALAQIVNLSLRLV